MSPRFDVPWLRFALGMSAYLLITLVQGVWMRDAGPSPHLTVPLAIAPLVPLTLGTVGWLRALRRRDELDRRVLSEAGGFSLTMLAAASLGWGLLETTAGFPRPSAFALVPMMAATYAIGVWRSARAYR